jgi:hypothetical protein
MSIEMLADCFGAKEMCHNRQSVPAPRNDGSEVSDDGDKGIGSNQSSNFFPKTHLPRDQGDIHHNPRHKERKEPRRR